MLDHKQALLRYIKNNPLKAFLHLYPIYPNFYLHRLRGAIHYGHIILIDIKLYYTAEEVDMVYRPSAHLLDILMQL